jgi:uncharacterized protein (TIGR02145 family)
LAGNYDGLLVKFNASGQRQWGTYFGGTGQEDLGSCIVNRGGNIYVSGDTKSTSGIATIGSHQSVYGGGLYDCFFEKFNQAGNRLWGTYYGGEGVDQGGIMNVDKNGNIFLTGTTHSDTGIATSGSYQPNRNSPNGENAFLAKLDSNGVRLWGTYYGGEVGEQGSACSTDGSGNVYFAGWTQSLANIASPGAFQQTYGGGPNDGFLAKFTTGGQRVWATYYGGANGEAFYGCSSDYTGNVCLVGETNSTNRIASPGCHQPAFGGGPQDAFIVKFDSLGQRQWGTYYGGTDGEYAYDCTFGWNNSIYMAGTSASVFNISTPDAYQPALAGLDDGFLVKFNAAGQRQWGTYYGGSGWDIFTKCVYIQGDTLCLAGTTHSSFNIASPGSYQEFYAGISDEMLVKFIECEPIDTVGPVSGPTNVCLNATGISYSVPVLAPIGNYIWTLPPGASIASGSGTNTITVNFSGAASSGIIWVKGVNKCGDSADSAYLFIILNTSPVVNVTISAPSNDVCEGIPVTFTATPVNGGGNPFFQWKVNSVGVGSNSTAYSYTPASGDLVYCILTSSINACILNNPDTSNTILMTVNPILPVSVSITASENPFCQGNTIIFTANPVNGGTTPIYLWKVNGIGIGPNSPIYSFVPNNGDVVSCVLNSNISCPTGNPATSNSITMVENTNVTVSVSITPSANPVCAGTLVTFTAKPTNGGTTPVYQWKVNGINVGSNLSTFIYTPASGDLVSCILTSNTACASGNPATSNVVTMTVNLNLPVSISINASANPVCSGLAVTYTAAPVNGGNVPVYQWKVNGSIVGTSSTIYTYNPASGDQIACILTSNIACPIGNPATSNSITMNVATSPTVTFTRCNDSITTINAQLFKLKGGIPLNGTYSGPGVNNGIFSPAIAGPGTKTISYTYSNADLCSATATSTIIVISPVVFICGNNLMDIRDGKTYQTIQIGGQCWMSEDLNYGYTIDESTNQRDNCIPEKYIRNSSSVIRNYYQWDEIMNYGISLADQGLCPPAWHVPTEADWNTLFANYQNNGFAASPLKYSGFSGFDALLSGARHLNKMWDYSGFAGFFWSSTIYGQTKAWAHGMNDADPSVSLYPALRSNAFSVRCLRDQ